MSKAKVALWPFGWVVAWYLIFPWIPGVDANLWLDVLRRMIGSVLAAALVIIACKNKFNSEIEQFCFMNQYEACFEAIRAKLHKKLYMRQAQTFYVIAAGLSGDETLLADCMKMLVQPKAAVDKRPKAKQLKEAYIQMACIRNMYSYFHGNNIGYSEIEPCVFCSGVGKSCYLANQLLLCFSREEYGKSKQTAQTILDSTTVKICRCAAASVLSQVYAVEQNQRKAALYAQMALEYAPSTQIAVLLRERHPMDSLFT